MIDKHNILIKTENLCVFQEENKILENVNIEIKNGEFVYFIGKVGSGKSSLLKTLYGELPIIEGSATVCDFDIKTLKRKHLYKLRRKIGMVFQDFELMTDRNVYKNLEFVLLATDWKDKEAIENRIIEVLEKVGMKDKIYSMPVKLSGGEKQSISIARALLNDPPLIFADEPTGNLDPDSAAKIMDILTEVIDENHSVIMVTHNYSLLKRYPGKVYLFEESNVNEYVEQYIDFDEI